MIKTVLNIDGMSCSMCESHINDTVRNNFDVKKVTSSHSNDTVEIISRRRPDTEKLKSILSLMGYRVTGFSQRPYKKRDFLCSAENLPDK